jgi:hypothetical protein
MCRHDWRRPVSESGCLCRDAGVPDEATATGGPLMLACMKPAGRVKWPRDPSL